MPLTSYKQIVPTSWTKTTYKEFITNLKQLKDVKYLEFNKKITTTSYEMIGINVPTLRKLAKEIKKTDIYKYLEYTEDKYFEEILLEGLVIGYINDYDEFITYFEKYLNKIDNWAICDLAVGNFKIIKTNKEKFINKIDDLVNSTNPYNIRVGIVSLLNHYIDDKNYLNYFFLVIDNIKSDHYYVNMAIAWFISYLFINYRSKTLKYLESNNLNDFTQNKAISKIRESYRVSSLDKKLVLKYKRK